MLLAEFDAPEPLARAVRALRDLGYRRLDAYTPYSTEVVREALGQRPSRLPLAVFAGGIAGAGAAYFLQWLTVAYLYPLDVGGRPPHMPLAFVPITFEMGILAAAFTAVLGVLIRGRLVVLWDPVFEAEGFETASADRFWLAVDGRDRNFAPDLLAEELVRLGARRQVLLPGRSR
jgi:hypothetical protein